jgi:uncharacterized protein
MEKTFSNHLAGETSPYLLQHAHNPVDWYPWNEESLNKAKSKKKLMIISIGYAACHWCHVMEKECFEDEETALAMNEHYVSIKVDREERPDVDQVYMHASYVVTGRGGWPLNVIALPDGRPVYAGTYFPKSNWMKVLDYFSSQFKTNPGELSRLAEEIHQGIKRFDKTPGSKNQAFSSPEELDSLFSEWKRIIDFKEGGTMGAPKFPMPGNLEFLLQYGFLTGNKEALLSVELTLDKMAAGGIFDQVGGGFSRYSVDDHWHIPHFEKMLYDNAQLVSIYSRAYRHFRKPRYEEIVRSTLAFIERELTSPEGLFYSSMDADSEGREGEFYAWKASEIREHLGAASALFNDYYCVTEEGNWEDGRNVLHVNEDDLYRKYGMSNEELQKIIKGSIETLFKVRQKRIPPALDNKILTGWNALMICGYVEAYKSFGDETLLAKAEKAALNFLNVLDQHHQLFRLYSVPSFQFPVSSSQHQLSSIEHPASSIQHPASSIQYPASIIHHPSSTIQKINAFLDDYAFLIKSFLDLYQVTFHNDWLVNAEKLINITVSDYFDSSSGLFFYTSVKDPALIDRKMELSDNVIPGSNSMMAMDLFIYGQITGKGKWVGLAKSMLGKMHSAISGNPSFHGNWSILLTDLLIPPYEIAIVGSQCLSFLREFNNFYLPHVLFYGGIYESGNEMLKGKEVEGKTMIYVCREQTCSEPLDSVEMALQYIQGGIEHGLHGS